MGSSSRSASHKLGSLNMSLHGDGPVLITKGWPIIVLTRPLVIVTMLAYCAWWAGAWITSAEN